MRRILEITRLNSFILEKLKLIFIEQRPDLLTPVVNVELIDEDRVEPGYWFIAPWRHTTQPAPYIFDNHGVGKPPCKISVLPVLKSRKGGCVVRTQPR